MRSIELTLLLLVAVVPVVAAQSDSIHTVVTGVRLPAMQELARGLTGRTATLTADEVDARGAASLAEAMDQLPGVTTSEDFDVTVRGFSVSPGVGIPQGVTVYVDGVRANEPDAHQVNFDLLPLDDVERVDIVYGPSVLLGRNSLGAAVNLVTRRGGDGGARELELAGGSFGRYELSGHAGATRSAWDYYVGAHYEHQDGWRAETQARVATLFAKLGLRRGPWDGTLSYSGALNRISQAGSLPESLFAANPRLNFTRGDYFAPQAHVATLNAQRLVLGGAQLAVNAFGRSIVSDQFNANFVGLDSRQRTSARQTGGAVQLSGKLRLGVHELRLLGGLDGDYLHTNVRIFVVPGGGNPDSLTEWVRTNQADVGAFAGANMRLTGGLTATAAARYDWIRLPLEDLLVATESGLNYFHRLSPRLGMTWTGGSKTRTQEGYAAVSRGFRAPALVEIGCSNPLAACPLPFALGSDPPLKPVVATTYELGWRTHHRMRGLDVSANVYQTDVRDDIFFVASTVTAGYFQNIGATRRAGFELSFAWAASSGLRLYGNYGYTRATFQTNADLATTRDTAGEGVSPGDWLPMVPDHRANAGFSMPVRTRAGACCGPAVSVGLDGRYVGRQWLRADEANETTRLPDYAVFDATVTVSWREIDMRWTIRNVLDRRYANFGTYAENPTVAGDPVQRWLTPGQPRSLQVSFTTEF